MFIDLRVSLAVIFGLINEIYGLDSVIYGYVRSYQGVSVMHIHIRLFRVLVQAPQYTSLQMYLIYSHLYGLVYGLVYVRKMRDTRP